MPVNWDKLKEHAAARGASSDGGNGNYDNSFLKLPEGLAKLRIIPRGNEEEELPYKIIKRHELPIVNADGKQTIFVLCWNWIKENPQAIGKYLARQGKLTKADVELAKKHGCPVCSAIEPLKEAKVSRETISRLFPSEKILWNVINRNDDNNVRVFTSSKTTGGAILGNIAALLEENMNPLDERQGFDLQISVQGNGLMRRYKNVMFLPVPKPLFPKGIDPSTRTPHSLTEIAAIQFKPYQETIEALQQAMGRVFNQYGYSIPGDANNWSVKQEPEEEEFEFVEPNKTKPVKREDYASAESFFDAAVPPDDSLFVVEEKPKKKVSNNLKATAKKPVAKPVEDDDPFDGQF